MTLADFTELNLLVPELLNERQESVVAELSRRLKEAGRIRNACAFNRAVLNHESMVSTVFDGVAFSLARGEIARELSFAIGLSRYGVRWGKKGAPIVFTVVLFAVPASAEQVYLSLVMTFSALLKNKVFFPLLCQFKHPKDMLAVLSQAFLSWQ